MKLLLISANRASRMHFCLAPTVLKGFQPSESAKGAKHYSPWQRPEPYPQFARDAAMRRTRSIPGGARLRPGPNFRGRRRRGTRAPVRANSRGESHHKKPSPRNGTGEQGSRRSASTCFETKLRSPSAHLAWARAQPRPTWFMTSAPPPDARKLVHKAHGIAPCVRRHL